MTGGLSASSNVQFSQSVIAASGFDFRIVLSPRITVRGEVVLSDSTDGEVRPAMPARTLSVLLENSVMCFNNRIILRVNEVPLG